ncbi:hypothetical protein cand_016300 [Cryptosporidium andersoni]|uniref:Transmembrane protein n=1 Tax=Cryptosporidium andersoni TaxID=117008 RepID=A0A1J4MTH3_9CRYT|nr:hypothetical protein cand_016300 [Cryptosporidium andersoni]
MNNKYFIVFGILLIVKEVYCYKTNLDTKDKLVPDKHRKNIDYDGIDSVEFISSAQVIYPVENKTIGPPSSETEFTISLLKANKSDEEKAKMIILDFNVINDLNIASITDIKLMITRFSGFNPHDIKITLLDPIQSLTKGDTRLSEVNSYNYKIAHLKQKESGRADIIELKNLISDILIVYKQFNSTNLRIMIEAIGSNESFGILSNMKDVGPDIVIQTKLPPHPRSKWIYTVIFLAVIFVVVGVIVAIYIQNKKRKQADLSNQPLLSNNNV